MTSSATTAHRHRAVQQALLFINTTLQYQCVSKADAPAEPKGLAGADEDEAAPLEAARPPSSWSSLPSSNSALKLAPISSTPMSSLRSRCSSRCTCKERRAEDLLKGCYQVSALKR